MEILSPFESRLQGNKSSILMSAEKLGPSGTKPNVILHCKRNLKDSHFTVGITLHACGTLKQNTKTFKVKSVKIDFFLCIVTYQFYLKRM